MPTSETDFQPGAVVIVPFPYADRLAEKRRPAVVVSGPAVLTAGYVWIAMITSARNVALSGDLAIADLEGAGLAVASVVRPIKIACIEPGRIVRTVGSLPAALADQVYTRVRGHIGPA